MCAVFDFSRGQWLSSVKWGHSFIVSRAVVIMSENEISRVHSEGREGRCINKELEETFSPSVVLK